MLIQFNTGYYHNGRLEMSRRRIAQHYTQTWLLFDILLISLDVCILEWGTFMIFYVLLEPGRKNIGRWGHKLSQAKLYRLEFFTFTVVRCRYLSQADVRRAMYGTSDPMWRGVSQLTMFDDRRVTLVSHSCQPTKG